VRILVIEDNTRLAASIQRGLVAHGYSVDVAHDAEQGEALAASVPYDLLVLDLMLPDAHGVELCKRLRRRGVQTPVLMLTALSSRNQKVAGLDAGADDYLTKPFEFEELLARIRAILRRGTASEASKLECHGLEIDLLTRSVRRDGREIRLSPKEFALLEFLARNQDRVVDRATIAQKVWDIRYEPSSNVIDVYIASLRKKIDRGFERPLIHTIVRMGYRLSAVEDEDGAER
jgi:DNA-binding response OmpR family regulator